jgi:hypothetical protein
LQLSPKGNPSEPIPNLIMYTTSSTYPLFLANCQRGVPVEVYFGQRGQHQQIDLRLYNESRKDIITASVLAYARIDRPTGRLLVHFLRQSLPAQQLVSAFSRNQLSISSEGTIAPAAARLLGLPEGHYTLPTGQYPVLTDDHFATVSLRLQSMQLQAVSTVVRQVRTMAV